MVNDAKESAITELISRINVVVDATFSNGLIAEYKRALSSLPLVTLERLPDYVVDNWRKGKELPTPAMLLKMAGEIPVTEVAKLDHSLLEYYRNVDTGREMAYHPSWESKGHYRPAGADWMRIEHRGGINRERVEQFKREWGIK